MAKLKIYLYCCFKYYFQEQSCVDKKQTNKKQTRKQDWSKMRMDGIYMEKGWRMDGVRIR